MDILSIFHKQRKLYSAPSLVDISCKYILLLMSPDITNMRRNTSAIGLLGKHLIPITRQSFTSLINACSSIGDIERVLHIYDRDSSILYRDLIVQRLSQLSMSYHNLTTSRVTKRYYNDETILKLRSSLQKKLSFGAYHACFFNFRSPIASFHCGESKNTQPMATVLSLVEDAEDFYFTEKQLSELCKTLDRIVDVSIGCVSLSENCISDVLCVHTGSLFSEKKLSMFLIGEQSTLTKIQNDPNEYQKMFLAQDVFNVDSRINYSRRKQKYTIDVTTNVRREAFPKLMHVLNYKYRTVQEQDFSDLYTSSLAKDAYRRNTRRRLED